MSSRIQAFQIPATNPLPVLSVARALLDYCSLQGSDLQQDMNDLGRRFAKNRVRTWTSSFLKFRQKDRDIHPSSLQVLNLLLANAGPLRHLITQLDAALGSIPFEGLAEASREALDTSRRNLSFLSQGLDAESELPCSCATIARGIAQAIDTIYGYDPESLIQARWNTQVPDATTPLEDGEVFPARRMTRAELNEIFGPPIYNLAHMDDDPGQLTCLRRHRKTALPVTMSFGFQSREVERLLLDKKDLVVGFACLGAMDSYRLRSEVAGSATHVIEDMQVRHTLSGELQERLPEHGGAQALGRFSGVEYGRQDVLQKIFQAACGRVDVLIFPELSLSKDTEQAILQQLKSPDCVDPPKVVFLGSRHINIASRGSEIRNRLSAAGSVIPDVLTHDKIGTFGFLHSDKCYYIEDIHRPRNLTVFNARGKPVAFLICKDILQSSVLDTLMAMSVRQLVVVAMSQKTEEFVQHLEEFSVRNNTRTFFSCFAPAGEVTAGVFAPVKNAAAILVRNAPLPPADGSSSRPTEQSTSGTASHMDDAKASFASEIDGPALAWIRLPVRDGETPRFHIESIADDHGGKAISSSGGDHAH